MTHQTHAVEALVKSKLIIIRIVLFGSGTFTGGRAQNNISSKSTQLFILNHFITKA